MKKLLYSIIFATFIFAVFNFLLLSFFSNFDILREYYAQIVLLFIVLIVIFTKVIFDQRMIIKALDLKGALLSEQIPNQNSKKSQLGYLILCVVGAIFWSIMSLPYFLLYFGEYPTPYNFICILASWALPIILVMLSFGLRQSKS